MMPWSTVYAISIPPYQVLKNNLKLWEAYHDVLTIAVESQEKTCYQAYTEAAARGEISEKLESD